MARVTDEDTRRALTFASCVKFRGTALTDLPDAGVNVVEELAKEFAKLRLDGFFNGVRNGVQRFAWWKDGVQYVGTTGRTLNQALSEVDTQESESRVG